MPADSIKISELETASTLNALDLWPVSQPYAQSQTGYLTRKVTTEQIASELLSELQYAAQLETTNKNIFGAINENKENIDGCDKAFADNSIVNLDGCTFSAFIASDLITFTIPLSHALTGLTNAEIYSLGNESFTIPGELSQGALSTLGDVDFVLRDGVGVVVNITNLAQTPAATGASVVHCEDASLLLTYVEPES